MPARRPSVRAHSVDRAARGTCRADARCRTAGRAARRASDRAARETPSTAGRPRPRSTSPCDRRRRRSGRCARGSSTPASTRRDEVGELDPAVRPRRTRRARRSGSARSSTTTIRTSRCRRSARGIRARARAASAVIRAASSAAGVVLPQPGVRREVVAPLRVERQRTRLRVDRKRRRAGGVDADADDALARRSPARRAASASAPRHGSAEPVDVVGRVLPRQVRVLRVQQHTRGRRSDSRRRSCRARAVGAVDDDGADGVGAEVDADGDEACSDRSTQRPTTIPIR